MTAREDPVVSVQSLKTYYHDDSIVGAKPPVRAVDGVDLDIREGETVGLVGESGSGKTTLGRTIIGLADATDGVVEADGLDVTEFDAAQARDWQRRVGMVFQDPEESLNDRMTIGEIVQEPLKAHDWPVLTAAVDGDATVRGSGVRPAEPDETVDLTVGLDGDVTVRDELPLSADAVSAAVDRSGDAPTVDITVEKSRAEIRRDRAFDLLDRVGLSEQHFYRYPHQFSGGQRQRIGIARALALEPEFVVLDEPVSALDVSVQARIINLLEDLQDEMGLTYLFIAHDLSVVRHIADRVAVMYLGNVVELGPTESVYSDPHHPYTVSLLSAIPGSGSPWSGERITLRGSPPNPRDPPAGCPFATRCPAKIRPDDYDLPERTWRALDELRVVFRTRARAEASAAETIKRLIGLDVAGQDLRETVSDLLADHDLPPAAQSTVDAAVELAAGGDDDAAAERLREAFGSRCDREHPEPYDGGEDRTSQCLRQEAEYDGVAETIRARQEEES
ncbi:ABC transporter ATP-binding protein [Halomicrobium sp. LC1Hm]|uniref:ABC transporter ATP-binding protein n=1 Tax=Halomicrobium sp. LC1Hm TaxID=2610902 RepID=UPI0012983FB1|nr:ABC transporter ATP-binding protein [Halomicrobium sp. LC1Hm]QGA83676.1 ABC-type oligopeptide transport system, ATPase component [Halomicrobium sp. LC1Hm]